MNSIQSIEPFTNRPGAAGIHPAQLILIRGIPGSGKSTMARTLTLIGYRHFEADMFFVRDGQYRYDPDRIREAHAWCQRMTREALNLGQRVVVSNTFTRKHELAPYLAMSQSARIVEAQGQWTNVHGVPADRIHQMRERWELIDSAVFLS